MFSIKTFRYVALTEAVSFLILLVAAVVKRTSDAPEGVEIMGPIHGVLFLAYVVIALGVRGPAGWSPRATIGVLIGAVLPFGGFVVDRWLARTGQLHIGLMAEPVDFEAAGLVGGLAGAARDARIALLTRLHAEGVSLDALRAAVADERLALLPVDRVLGGEPCYTADEVAAAAGIEPQMLVDALAAFGLTPVGPAERRLGAADLAAAHRMRAALDAGLPAERVVDVNRVVGRAMAQVAAAIRVLVGEAFMSAGNTEEVVAERLEAAARALIPALGPTLEHAFALHLRELLRSDAIDAAVLRSGAFGGDGPVSVAFADLVGFTWLGGQIPPDELGRVARRLEELTQAALLPHVRLVKTIGDAVMLVSPDAVALVRTMLALVDAAGIAADADAFPRLRAGIATGAARERDGDVYGHAVNLASRLTALARPGSVLTDDTTHDVVGREVTWSFAGERRIKGLPDAVRLFRARQPPAAAAL